MTTVFPKIELYTVFWQKEGNESVKKTILCIVVLVLVLGIVLALVLAKVRIAPAEPSDNLKAVYDALVAEGSAFSRNQNVIRDFNDGSSLEAVLDNNGITITETNTSMDIESESWAFIQEGDWLTVSLEADEDPYGGKAGLIWDAAISAQGVNSTLFTGYLNAFPDLGSKYYIVEESDAGARVSINIAGPYEIDMEKLSEPPLTEEYLRGEGWEPLGEDYDAPSIAFGKVEVACFGNAGGVEISVMEYGGLDELALDAVVSTVKVLQPKGWVNFIANYTELKDAGENGYIAMLNPDEATTEDLFVLWRDGYSTAYFSIGQIDYL